MDELNSSFGRLSTNAPEWRPREGGETAGVEASVIKTETSTVTTDLNPSKVKEFVPGQAWSPATGDVVYSEDQFSHVSASSTYNTGGDGLVGYDESTLYQQQQPLEEESTIPAGPHPPPPPSSLTPNFRALHSLGVSDDLWRHYREQALNASRQMEPNDPRHNAVPLPYCNAFCLDPVSLSTRSSFGYPSNTFQVTNREDGFMYCLRRIDNCKTVSHKIAATITERWTHPSVAAIQEHPNVVPLVSCFVSQRAVFFVHRFIPGAQTIQERLAPLRVHHRHPRHAHAVDALLPESVLWSCLAQLVSAISAIHSAGLAVRSLDANHVLVTSLPPTLSSANMQDGLVERWRLYVNCVGVADALEFETRRHIYEWQQLDMRALGFLMITMATVGRHEPTRQLTMTNTSIVEAEAVLAQNYSRELHNLVMTLLRTGSNNLQAQNPHRPPNAAVPPPSPSIRDVSRAIWSHMQVETDNAYRDLDRMSSALASEYDSSRFMRILLKLGFINERPELGPNRRWIESGDCYVLTLFRDYVFHQADGAGYPVMDLGHVVAALNKLDARDPEKIVLVSRDGISIMVVSYEDVARCLDSAFLELCASSVAAPV